MKYNQNIDNNRILILTICLIYLYSLFFPMLESPDEGLHLERIINETTLWGEILNKFLSFFIDIDSLVINNVTYNENFTFGENELRIFEKPFVIEYLIVKFINTTLVLVLFFIIIKIFNGNKFSIAFPSSTYYMSLISSDNFGSVLMLGSTHNRKKLILLSIFFSLLVLIIDRSIIIFIVFLTLKLIFVIATNNNLNKLLVLSKIFLLMMLMLWLLSIFNFNFLYQIFSSILSENYSVHMLYSHSRNPSHINQFIGFLMSGMMLSGSMSFYPTIIYYIIFGLVIYKSIMDSLDIENKANLILGMSIYFLFASIYPELSQFRYYLFLAPLLAILIIRKYGIRILFLFSLIALIYNLFIPNLLYYLGR